MTSSEIRRDEVTAPRRDPACEAIDARAREVALSLPATLTPAAAARIAANLTAAREDLARRDAAQRPRAAKGSAA